jgi:hypothetical protein
LARARSPIGVWSIQRANRGPPHNAALISPPVRSSTNNFFFFLFFFLYNLLWYGPQWT